MRRVTASFAALLLLAFALPPAPTLDRVVVQPALRRVLAEAHPKDALRVFVHAADAATARAAVVDAGLSPLTSLDAVGVAVAWGAPAAIARVANLPEVRYVEADARLTFATDSSHVATRGIAAARRRDALGRPLDGTGVSIAIVDSGVDGSHPMFQLPDGSSKVRRNLKDICGTLAPGDPYPNESFNRTCWVTALGNDSDTLSGAGHGTHVAATAAGRPMRTNDGRTIRGAAPGATLIALGVGAGPSVYGAAAALNWVLEHHADPCGGGACPPIGVVNNSYSTVSGSYDADGVVERLQQELVRAGVVVVWAAGNSGGDGSRSRTNVYAHTPTMGVVSVANYDDQDEGSRDGELSSTSSRGEAGQLLTYPDVSAPGHGISSACRPWLLYCASGTDLSDRRTARMSGTSMAAPHVAGIVAQMLQANPRLRPANVEDILEETADPIAAAGEYEPDPTNAGTRTSFDAGHGLVDAARAVDVALAVR